MQSLVKNRLDEETMIFFAAWILACKTLALEVSEPSGELAGKSVEQVLRFAVSLAEAHLKSKPRPELLAFFQELGSNLEIEFVPNENGDHRSR